jgi:hypothetical protein
MSIGGTGGGPVFGGGTGGGPLFGSGGFFGSASRPSGPFGPWAGCGCSSLFIILAGMLLVCGGLMRMLNF